MAEMVKAAEPDGGTVVGIDYIPELVDFSIQNVQGDVDHKSLLASPHFKLVRGDGWKGYPDHAPYHAIHVGAAAAEIPKALEDQLAPGGKMVIPVGTENQTFFEVTRSLDGKITREGLFGVRYVPLVKLDSSK